MYYSSKATNPHIWYDMNNEDYDDQPDSSSSFNLIEDTWHQLKSRFPNFDHEILKYISNQFEGNLKLAISYINQQQLDESFRKLKNKFPNLGDQEIRFAVNCSGANFDSACNLLENSRNPKKKNCNQNTAQKMVKKEKKTQHNVIHYDNEENITTNENSGDLSNHAQTTDIDDAKNQNHQKLSRDEDEEVNFYLQFNAPKQKIPRRTNRTPQRYTKMNEYNSKTIDLHNMRHDEAKIAVLNEIETASKSGIDELLVITGRGVHSKNNIPVLRPMVQKLCKQKSILFESVNGGFRLRLKACSKIQ